MRLDLSKIGLASLIVFTCLLIYAFFWSGVHYSIDGIMMFEYAKALLFQHSFTMNPPVRWNNNDYLVSKWPIGQTLAYVPSLWILANTFFRKDPSYTKIPYNPDLPGNPQLSVNTAYRSVSYINALITACTAMVLFLLLINLGFSKRKASIVALIFGLASPAAVYSKFDFAQPMAALWLLMSFWLVIKARDRERRLYYFFSGLLLGFAILTRTELLVFQFPLMVVVVFLIASKDGRIFPLTRSAIWKVLAFCLPVLLIVMINQYLNYLRFGNWFATGYKLGSLFRPDIVALIGNLISPGRGLFIFFPFALMSVLSIRQLKSDKILWAMFLSAFGSILFYSIFNDGWAAGLAWGPRLLIPYIPLFAILGFIGFEQLNARFDKFSKTILVILIGLGGIFSLQGLLFNFARFYGDRQITSQDVLNGLYNFSVKYSPILSDWTRLFSPKEYDIYWFQHPSSFQGGSQIILVSLGIGMGIVFSIWVMYFRSKIPDCL